MSLEYLLTSDEAVDEARSLARGLIETEKGRSAGNVTVAIHQVASRLLIEEGTLNSLWLRCRLLKSVPGHVLNNLRAGYEVIYEQQRQALARQVETGARFERKSTTLEARLEQCRPLVGHEDERDS